MKLFSFQNFEQKYMLRILHHLIKELLDSL